LGDPENKKHPLITGIEKNARDEAEKIMKEAKAQADERKKYLDKQVESILREAEEKALARADAIKNRLLSGYEVEFKRKRLRARDTVLDEIHELVRKELRLLVENNNYREILLNWICEAMIGLGVQHAYVSTSVHEKRFLDKGLLSEAEKKVKAVSGISVKLELSKEPTAGQGVVLTAADGRTAFNNQVSVRLLRKQREITKMIYSKIFGEAR
jgi:vacuolar-type H+-ATPase subunit E/Vma4